MEKKVIFLIRIEYIWLFLKIYWILKKIICKRPKALLTEVNNPIPLFKNLESQCTKQEGAGK